MSDGYQYGDDLLGDDLLGDELLMRVRADAPAVPGDVLAATGSAALRVFARVTAIPPAPERPAFSPRGRWRGRRRVGLLSGATTVLAGVVVAAVVLIVSLGGGTSIVERAYAATDPAGVIVHYTETTRSSMPGDDQRVTYWLNGASSRQIIDIGKPKLLQDIVTTDGHLENLGRRMLVIEPYHPGRYSCRAGMALEGYCAGVRNGTPLDGLRSLLRSGAIHATGLTTIAGRRLDVLVGNTIGGPGGALRIRALVDAHSFIPVKVTMTNRLPTGDSGKRAVVLTLTISGYQRLAVTPRNLQHLALPAHPHVRVIRRHACPTKRQPNRLCR